MTKPDKAKDGAKLDKAEERAKLAKLGVAEERTTLSPAAWETMGAGLKDKKPKAKPNPKKKPNPAKKPGPAKEPSPAEEPPSNPGKKLVVKKTARKLAILKSIGKPPGLGASQTLLILFFTMAATSMDSTIAASCIWFSASATQAKLVEQAKMISLSWRMTTSTQAPC